MHKEDQRPASLLPSRPSETSRTTGSVSAITSLPNGDIRSEPESPGFAKQYIESAFSMQGLTMKPDVDLVSTNLVLQVIQNVYDPPKRELVHLNDLPELLKLHKDRAIFSKVSAHTDEELQKMRLSKEDLFDLMLDPFHYRLTIYTLVVDTYMWFTTEKDLFSYLIVRYFTQTPLGMSTSEARMFEEKILQGLRTKILLFLGAWYSKYKDLVLTIDSLQGTFAEAIHMLVYYTEPTSRSKMAERLGQLLGIKDTEKYKDTLRQRIAELEKRDKKITDNMNRLQQENQNQVEKYDEFFHLLKNESRKLAEQICLFDFENFQLLLPNELLATNWSREKKKDLAPNIVYISESFNRLSRLLTLYVFTSKDNKEFIKRTDEVISLSDNLMYLNNFNSAYAVHLAISNVWVKNYMQEAGVKISSRAKEAFEKQKTTFSVDKGQYRLQQEQFKAQYPCIPFLGLYVQQILVVCERKDTFVPRNSQLINLEKFWDLEKILQKIITTRDFPYTYVPNPKVQKLLQNLPPSKKAEEKIKNIFNTLMTKYEKKRK